MHTLYWAGSPNLTQISPVGGSLRHLLLAYPTVPWKLMSLVPGTDRFSATDRDLIPILSDLTLTSMNLTVFSCEMRRGLSPLISRPCLPLKFSICLFAYLPPSHPPSPPPSLSPALPHPFLPPLLPLPLPPALPLPLPLPSFLSSIICGSI